MTTETKPTRDQQRATLRKAIDVLTADGVPEIDYRRVSLEEAIKDHDTSVQLNGRLINGRPCWDDSMGECCYVVRAREILRAAGVADG